MDLRFRLRDPGDRPSISDLQAFEQEFELRLPEDYSRFLVEYNGGLVDIDYHQYSILAYDNPSLNQIGHVVSFFKLGKSVAGRPIGLRESMNVMPERGMPPHLVPFADNAFGDDLCISTARHDYGHVYFTYHDSPEPWERNLFSVANSFSEFVGSLRYALDET